MRGFLDDPTQEDLCIHLKRSYQAQKALKGVQPFGQIPVLRVQAAKYKYIALDTMIGQDNRTRIHNAILRI
ncbi:hypothetical protein PsorP6_011210 [Peronosclerospora sorghi]|uniref:Uncharacterized protein n=1 Tax=Peronosclerospora sorghi TaxID=230839 RepID=A0ACC0VWS1_9STRA|nr:hypothetical protein PsorP6_011210 [Peronosclerospora sorghi]